MPSRKKFRKNKRKSRKRQKKGGQTQPNGYTLNSDHVADYYFNKALNQVDSETGYINYRYSKISNNFPRSSYRLGEYDKKRKKTGFFGSKKKEENNNKNVMELSILRIMNDFIEKYNNSSSTKIEKVQNVSDPNPKKKKQEKKFEFDSETLKTISKSLVELEKKEEDAYDVPIKDEKYSIYKENIKKKNEAKAKQKEEWILETLAWNKKCINPLHRFEDYAWKIVLENKTSEEANKEKLNYTSKKEYVKGNTYNRGDYVFITEEVSKFGKKVQEDVMYVAKQDGKGQSEVKEMKELNYKYSSSSPNWQRYEQNPFYGDTVLGKEKDAITRKLEKPNTSRVEIIKRHEEYLKKIKAEKQEIEKKLETAENYDDLSKKLDEIDNEKEQLAKGIIDQGWEGENAFLTASNNDLLGKKLDSIGKYIWHSPFMYKVKMWGHYEKKSSVVTMDEKKLSKERQNEGLTPENCGKLLLACVLLIVNANDYTGAGAPVGFTRWPLDRKWGWTIGKPTGEKNNLHEPYYTSSSLQLVGVPPKRWKAYPTNEKGELSSFFLTTDDLLDHGRSCQIKSGESGVCEAMTEYEMYDGPKNNPYSHEGSNMARHYTQYNKLDIDKKFLVKTLYKNIIKSLTEDYYKSEDNKMYNDIIPTMWAPKKAEEYASDGLYKKFIDKKPHISYKEVESLLVSPDGNTGITIKGNTGGGRKRRRRKKRTRKRRKGKSRRKKRTRRR